MFGKSLPAASGEPGRYNATMDAATIAAADHAARNWRGTGGRIRLGSEAHKRLFCRMFRETFNPYKPSVLDWPKLDPEARERLTSLPIWDIAVQTEGKARLRMLSYAATLRDPLLNAVIALNGWEEGRHKEVLSHLVAAYGIVLEPEPEYVAPRDPEWAYLVTGYSECVDSSFPFGLLKLAKRSGNYPPAKVKMFEPVTQEETRHIILFVNWAAWYRRNLSWWRRIAFEAKVVAVWGFLIWERIGLARAVGSGGAKPDNSFTVTGSKSVSSEEVRLGELLDICLAENARRMSGYDPRLVRPRVMPVLSGRARRIGRRFGW